MGCCFFLDFLAVQLLLHCYNNNACYNVYCPILVPTGSPVTFFAMASSSTSILLTWDPPPIHERNGIITSYTITHVVAGNSSTLTTADQMLLVTNLRPFTPYTFEIAASTSIGLGPRTSPLTENTPEAGI